MTALRFSIDQVLLTPSDPATNGVIDRLPTAAAAGSGSRAHTAHGSDFDYLDHYEKDAEVFDYFAPYEDAATVHENRRLHETILREIPASAASVLDIGCGNAWLAEALTPRGLAVVSFDIASKNLKRALTRVPSENHYAVRGDVLALPFEANSFDTVVSSEVIEHVPHLKGYLDNIIRVLKPGGRAVITTPYDEKIQYSLCIHCNRQTPLHAHIHSFREDSLDKLMLRHPTVSLRAYTTSNKALLYARGHKVLGGLGYDAWRAVDSLANWVVNKPARLVFVLTKGD